MSQADQITRKHTAFGSYAELLAAMDRGYLPTVHRTRQAELRVLLASKSVFLIG